MSRYETEFSFDGRPVSRGTALERHRNYLAQRQQDVLIVLPSAIGEVNSARATVQTREVLDKLAELEHALLESQIALLNDAERRLEGILVAESRRLGLPYPQYSARTANSGCSAERSRRRRRDDDSSDEQSQ